jgi:hypothetical protein
MLAFWAICAVAFGDQFDARRCRDEAGRFMPCEGLPAQSERLPIVDPLPSGPAPGYEPKPDTDFALDAGLGAVASLSSEASSAEPTAEVNASFDLATNDKSPRLSLAAFFRALPGEAVNLSDPTTFRSLGLEGTLSQPLWSNLRLRPALLLGAEFRFAADEQPLHRAARYAYVGTRVDGDDGYLFLGVGGDERLSVNSRETPQYLPAANVSWRLRLGSITGAIDAALTGRVLLYLRLGYGQASAGSDVAQVGVLIGFGAKR